MTNREADYITQYIIRELTAMANRAQTQTVKPEHVQEHKGYGMGLCAAINKVNEVRRECGLPVWFVEGEVES